MNWSAQITVVISYLTTLLFFLVVQRPLFYLYNRRSSSDKPTFRDLLKIYRHGILSDFIVSAYLTVIPMLILWIWYNFPCFSVTVALWCATTLISIPVSALVVADSALYDFWHFKIDRSVLIFLRSIKGATASVSTKYLIAGGLAFIAIAAIYTCLLGFVYNACANILLQAEPTPVTILLGNIAFVLMLVVLAAIVRGFRIRPNNPTIVLFSPIAFYNHIALNGIFNFIYSLGTTDGFSNIFNYYPEKECDNARKELFPTKGTPAVEFLKNDRPNIIFIVWESLNAKFFEGTGGDPSVTPNLNRISREESVTFTEIDCGSFLTDRGLISIFSGIPGQPTTTIGKFPRKLPFLPALPRRLKELGYSTAVIHGGDLSVRQKADYYLASGHDTLIAEKDFSSSEKRCKWGVHDEGTFNRLFDEIMKKEKSGKPWMLTLQTLSSHEPFIVPFDRLDDKMKNAFAYTDQCLGDFVEKLRKTPAWDNTMIVVVADHGTHYSAEYGIPLNHYEFPKIPVVIFGGAVKGPLRINSVAAQTDLAATILGQMHLPHDEFLFSRDILSPTYKDHFAYHSYHSGICIRTPDGWTDFSTITSNALWGPDEERERRAKVTVQSLYQYLDKL